MKRMRPNSSSMSTSSGSCRRSTLSNVLSWWGFLQNRPLVLIFLCEGWYPCRLFNQHLLATSRCWRQSSLMVTIHAPTYFMFPYAMKMVRRGPWLTRISNSRAFIGQRWMRSLRQSLQPIYTSANFPHICFSSATRISDSRPGLLVSNNCIMMSVTGTMDNIYLDTSAKWKCF
jgi:hypothetical protein